MPFTGAHAYRLLPAVACTVGTGAICSATCVLPATSNQEYGLWCRVPRRMTPPPTVDRAICLGDGITPAGLLHLSTVVLCPEDPTILSTRPPRPSTAESRDPQSHLGSLSSRRNSLHSRRSHPTFPTRSHRQPNSRKQPALHTRMGSAIRLGHIGPRMLVPLLAWWQSSILPLPCM